jgi:Na+-transporting methylmalonyl-CoA/oxaloacetate decarboxylase gamma subunit
MPVTLPGPPLAALPDHPGLLENLGFQLNGLIVVFTALALIWGLMELLGACFRQRAASAQLRATASLPAPAAPPPPVSSDTPPGHLVVIAAAVHATLGARARIVALAPHPDAQDWAAEGRRQIFSTRKAR